MTLHSSFNSANFYLVTESAKHCQPQGLRARKREATRSAITAAARRLTSQNGLNGFTIEQLCEQVGVSRRTFFNYFPSKEDAIIGYLLDEFPADALEKFLHAAGPDSGVERGPLGLSTTLLRDLFRLANAMVEELNISKEHLQELAIVMKREPQLMLKVIGSAEYREREFAGLIAQRENLAVDDPATNMAAAIFGTCSQRAGQLFFSEANTLPFQEILANNLHMAQQIFNFSTLPADLSIEGTP
ncbi:TetR family transcriptional regulator [Arthrobacter psychrolactophilus]|uniref:TetR family transcriptional regulator n=1 Tax=Arthrobacter psychrolactophilus TaxID=92442 RepID=A0A2V5J7H5_9MICC|nr:TetR family transcriptional regulator [Arthrobacter psychrolactophilus]